MLANDLLDPGTRGNVSDDAVERAANPADPNQAFYDKANRALRELFDNAKAKHELHFAMALMPEMRGAQVAGWNTAQEAVTAFDEYSALLKSMNAEELVRIRVLLAFYLHASECSGFYEKPRSCC